MRRSHFMPFVIVVILCIPNKQSSAALVFMEWSGEPGVIGKTLQVGETATIDIRLELVAGETFGEAYNFDLGVGSYWHPDDTPNFQITDYADNNELGTGQLYQRWPLPALPFSPDKYDLTMQTHVPPVVGPATMYLDRLEIVALSVGDDDIVFGATFQGYPSAFLLGEDELDWIFVDGYTQPGAEYWTFGVGHPGQRPFTPHGTGLSSKPLELVVVPEPGAIAMLSVGVLCLQYGRRRKSA